MRNSVQQSSPAFSTVRIFSRENLTAFLTWAWGGAAAAPRRCRGTIVPGTSGQAGAARIASAGDEKARRELGTLVSAVRTGLAPRGGAGDQARKPRGEVVRPRPAGGRVPRMYRVAGVVPALAGRAAGNASACRPSAVRMARVAVTAERRSGTRPSRSGLWMIHQLSTGTLARVDPFRPHW